MDKSAGISQHDIKNRHFRINQTSDDMKRTLAASIWEKSGFFSILLMISGVAALILSIALLLHVRNIESRFDGELLRNRLLVSQLERKQDKLEALLQELELMKSPGLQKSSYIQVRQILLLNSLRFTTDQCHIYGLLATL